VPRFFATADEEEDEMKSRIFDNVMLFVILVTIGLAYTSALFDIGYVA
jgi:hypothetical protein